MLALLEMVGMFVEQECLAEASIDLGCPMGRCKPSSTVFTSYY